MTDSTDNPWTVRSSRPIYANPWIAVTEHQVLTPAGKPGIYGTVHYRNLALAALPIDAEGMTWLVGQYRFPLSAYSWEVPEGGGRFDRPPLDEIQRELAEECGLAAARWQRLLTIHLSNSVSDEIGHGYLAWELSPAAGEPDETERLSLRRVPFAEAYAMASEGAITDSLSVALIFRARLLALEGRLPDPVGPLLAR